MKTVYLVKYRDPNDPSFGVRTDRACPTETQAQYYVDWANKAPDQTLEFFVEELVYE